MDHMHFMYFSTDSQDQKLTAAGVKMPLKVYKTPMSPAEISNHLVSNWVLFCFKQVKKVKWDISFQIFLDLFEEKQDFKTPYHTL